MDRKRSLFFAAGFITAFLLAIVPVRAVSADDKDNFVVEAGNTEEFINAIADDTTIVLKPGVYNVTEYLDSSDPVKEWTGEEKKSGVYRSDSDDGTALLIYDIENLSIVSSDPNNPAEIVCEPRRADVLCFDRCEDILLEGLVMGHTKEPGYCSGDVVSFIRSGNILIIDSELYGCGAHALETDYCEDVKLIECDIHDCTYGCVVSRETEELNFIHTQFHDCRDHIMFELAGGKAALIGCSLQNLQGTLTDSKELKLINTEIENCFDDFKDADTGDDETQAESDKPDHKGKPADTEKRSESEETGFPTFTLKSHPMKLVDRNVTLATANYYEIILSDETKEKYPELAQTIEDFNKNWKNEGKAFFEKNEKDIQELMANTGHEFSYEDEIHVAPERIDDLVFSIVMSEYTYLGGAHGDTVFKCFNFDPSSGKDIDLDEVVTDLKGFGRAMFTELSASEEYAEYYRDYPEGEQEFFDAVTPQLDNNGKGLTWALGYEGVWAFFDDYTLGPYAMGAPSVLVRFEDYPELFNDRYVFKGKAPESDPDMMYERDAVPETIRSKRHMPQTLPLSWHQEGFWPENEEDYPEGYSYYTYTDAYTVPEKDYPRLSKRLDELNAEYYDVYDMVLPLLRDEAESEYVKGKEEDFWPVFSRGTDFSLCRADDQILSFAAYNNFSGINDDPTSSVQGINIDVQTGKDVDLYDVITTKEAFMKAFDQSLSENTLYVKKWKDTVRRLTETAFSDDKIISSAESGLSFTVDYQGLMLYYNEEDTGFEGGPSTVFIGFEEHPEVFADTYTNVPVNYASEIAIGDYESVYWYDFNGDGIRESFSLILSKDINDQYLYHLSLRWDDTVVTLDETGAFYNVNAFLMHDTDRDYLYVETTSENDYQTLYVFEITTEAIALVNSTEGCIKFMTYNEDGNGGTGGCLPTNPRKFSMEIIDYTLGTNWLIGDYCVDWVGMPDANSYYLDYIGDYWYIRAAEDIKAVYTDEEDFEEKSGTIKKGTEILLYQRGMDKELRIKTRDGKIWQLIPDDKDGVLYYNGKELNDLFEGQIYAG